MLVYSTTLWLKNSSNVDSVRSVVSRWLSRRVGETINSELLKPTSQKRTRRGNVQVITSDANYPMLQSVSFTHADREISGRQWIVEIGIRQERNSSEIECSILLKTDEVSTRVAAQIQPTVPWIVHDLIKECSPSPGTVGLTLKVLDNETEIEAFGYAIEYSERRHPYVLVSPTTGGTYFVDLEKLRFLLEGLADVVQIPEGADTFLISRILGRRYATWGGAINLIFPEIHSYGKRFAPTRRFFPEQLDQLISEGMNVETEILSSVTHQTNLPNSLRHISPETVSEVIRRRELTQLQKRASETGEYAEYIALLEEDNGDQAQRISEQQEKISQLQTEITATEDVIGQMDDDKRQLKFENDSLKLTLSYSGDSGDEQTGRVSLNSIQGVLIDVAAKSFTPRESLLVITRLFSDRVEALESAWKSSEESDSFKEAKRAFELLWKLATDYWNELARGKGDAEARSVFGNAYSAHESETVEGNKRARQLRKFRYKGKEVEMMKHLKIGNKNSVAETIRIHFEWDATDRKIIIGHCGPHLDHR